MGCKLIISIGSLVCFLIITHNSVFGQIYVDPDNTSNMETGESWAHAITDLHTALSIAEPGGEIWVRKGAIKTTSDLERDKSFIITKPIRVYGGFNGTETSISERQAGARTILSGEIGDLNSLEDNAYTILAIRDVPGVILIDGFTFTRGMANDTSELTLFADPRKSGGAIHINAENNAGEVWFRNCDFTDNYAIHSGGAIYNRTRIQKTTISYFRSCTFEGNRSDYGGGAISMDNMYFPAEAHLIDNSTFDDNSSFLGGSLKIAVSDGSLRISGTAFNNSEARFNGGIAHIELYGKSSRLLLDELHITDCGLNRNTGGDEGAGFKIDSDPSQLYPQYVSLRNSTIEKIYATNAQGERITANLLGGYMPNDSIIIEGCTVLNSQIHFHDLARYFKFHNNKLIKSPLYLGHGPEKIITNLVIVYGGVYAGTSTDESTTISNLLLIRDENQTGPLLAFNLLIELSTLTLHNFIMMIPEEENHEGYLLAGGQINLHLKNGIISKSNLDNAIISNSTQVEPTISMENVQMGVQPIFVDYQLGDFRLHPCSPGVDMGFDEIIFQLGLEEDFEGKDRIIGEHVDIGIYETRSVNLVLDSISHILCDASEGGAIFPDLEGIDTSDVYLTNASGQSFGIFDEIEAGQYLLIYQDDFGCHDTLDFTLESPLAIESGLIEEVKPCFGEQTGRLMVYAEGGNPPLSFLWDHGPTSQTLEGIGAGTYMVEVIDSQDCLHRDTFELREHPSIDIQLTSQMPSTSNSDDGSIITEVTGGVLPYTFYWGDGSEMQNRTQLSSDTYSLTVTDAAGCTRTVDIVLEAKVNNTESSFRVWPNPLEQANLLKMQVVATNSGLFRYKLIDVLGRIYFENSIELPEGLSIVEQNFPVLNGLYYLQMEIPGRKEVFPICILTK